MNSFTFDGCGINEDGRRILTGSRADWGRSGFIRFCQHAVGTGNAARELHYALEELAGVTHERDVAREAAGALDRLAAKLSAQNADLKHALAECADKFGRMGLDPQAREWATLRMFAPDAVAKALAAEMEQREENEAVS